MSGRSLCRTRLSLLSHSDVDSDSEASDSELSDSPSLDSDIEQEQEKSYERLSTTIDNMLTLRVHEAAY